MNNYSILFSIKIGGPSQNYKILSKALESIKSKISSKNYQILISYETNNLSMVNFIENMTDSRIIKNKVDNYSWYDWMINSSQIAKNFDYLFLMHDDIFFLTKNFDQLLHINVNNKDGIGIINFKDTLYEDGYYKSQTRHGFYKDKMFELSSEKGLFAEFHKQKPFWHTKNQRLKNILFKLNIHNNEISKKISSNLFFNIKNIYMPEGIVKTHGGYNDLMIFKKENLNIFDNICDFKIPYGLTSDEDLCLSSLKLGLNNIWISEISYKSNYEFNFVTTRSYNLHANDQFECNKIFQDKWGFPSYFSNKLIDENISFVKKAEKLHGRNIVWTKDFNSFEYQYL